jgi:hypothetical protein
MARILLNVSGHPLSRTAKRMLEVEYDVVETLALPEIDFSSPVEEQIRDIFTQTKSPLDGSNPVTVVLPGHATVAVLVLIYLHGLLGHYPSICLLEQRSGEYVPTNLFSIDAQRLRMSGRAFRQQLILDQKRHVTAK